MIRSVVSFHQPRRHRRILSTGIRSRIATFNCPSSPLPGNNNFFGRQAPGNNYFASVGSSTNFNGMLSASGRPNGVFRYEGGAIGIRDVTDGTANTLFFSEWRIGDFNVNRLSPQDVVNIGNVFIGGGGQDSPLANMPLGATALVTYSQTCATSHAIGSTAAPTGNRSWIGEQWATGIFGRSLGNVLFPPNTAIPNGMSCAGCGDFDGPGIFGMSSNHPGGANALFGDGSVRFLKNTLALPIVWSIGSRDQGEVVSADAL